MRLSAVIKKEGKWFVAWCPELDIASQGKTKKEAISNLREAIELYLEDEDAERPKRAEIINIEVNARAKTTSTVST